MTNLGLWGSTTASIDSSVISKNIYLQIQSVPYLNNGNNNFYDETDIILDGCDWWDPVTIYAQNNFWGDSGNNQPTLDIGEDVQVDVTIYWSSAAPEDSLSGAFAGKRSSMPSVSDHMALWNQRKYVKEFLDIDRISEQGNKTTAIMALESKADEYNGRFLSNEMLARAARIAGYDLNDRITAKRLADKIKANDPNSYLLKNAYDSAGIDYDSIKEPDQPQASKQGPFVMVSPNPANPMTTISYKVDNASKVRLDIFSITGQKVTTLVNGFMESGNHSVVLDGSKFASGLYIYRFEAQGIRKTGKLTILK
jgi:hypothetical protein